MPYVPSRSPLKMDGNFMSVSLQFALPMDEDWPPIGSESLPFDKVGKGYRCLSVPLFVKDLSVGDVIEINKSSGIFIESWCHIERSNRSTLWLLRLSDNPPIQNCLVALRLLECNTTGLDEFGCYAVDIPESVSIIDVDAILDELDDDLVAIAFPSMRHPD